MRYPGTWQQDYVIEFSFIKHKRLEIFPLAEVVTCLLHDDDRMFYIIRLEELLFYVLVLKNIINVRDQLIAPMKIIFCKFE
jgi:hypothetical protein